MAKECQNLNNTYRKHTKNSYLFSQLYISVYILCVITQINNLCDIYENTLYMRVYNEELKNILLCVCVHFDLLPSIFNSSIGQIHIDQNSMVFEVVLEVVWRKFD